jgi:hypothetical protein
MVVHAALVLLVLQPAFRVIMHPIAVMVSRVMSEVDNDAKGIRTIASVPAPLRMAAMLMVIGQVVSAVLMPVTRPVPALQYNHAVHQLATALRLAVRIAAISGNTLAWFD